MAEHVSENSTEDVIFDAALHVFARKGRDGARMQEIADRAGLNKALLHYYFRSKDRLYEAALDVAFRRYVRAMDVEIPVEMPFSNVISTFIDRYVDFLVAHPEEVRLFVHENLEGGSGLSQRLADLRKEQGSVLPLVLEDRIAAGIATSDVRQVDPTHALLSLVSMSIFPLIVFPTARVMHPNQAGDMDAFVAARKAHITDLFCHGLCTNQPGNPA